MDVWVSSQFSFSLNQGCRAHPPVCVSMCICGGVSRKPWHGDHPVMAMGWYLQLEWKPLFREIVPVVPHLQPVIVPLFLRPHLHVVMSDFCHPEKTLCLLRNQISLWKACCSITPTVPQLLRGGES